MKLPDAMPFEPGQAAASVAIEALTRDPESAPAAVLLAVSPKARRSGWAKTAAIALADAWAGRGEPVILADLSLDAPQLHETLGVANEEGMSDVFLFGVSVPHVTVAVPGKSFQLIAASPFTPDVREVLTHRRWDNVLAELNAGGSRLIAYLPMDLDGSDAFASRVTDTIVLADESDLAALVLPADANVIAVLVPRREEVTTTSAPPAPVTAVQTATIAAAPAPPVAAAQTVTPSPEPEPKADTPLNAGIERRSDAEFEKIRIPKDGARDALIADLRARQRAALMAPAPDMAPLPDAEAIQAAPAGEKARDRPPGPIFRLPAEHPTGKPDTSWVTRWLLLGIVLGAAIFAGWYWYREQMADTTSTAAIVAAPAQRAPATAPGAAPAAAASRALPFSVAIASYQVLDLAEARLAQLEDDEPELTFFVGPIAVQGTMFYRVMAGPVGDSASATSLVTALVEKRIKTITSGWDVLTTPYAFLLGAYASSEDARAMQRTAALKGIPTYIVEGSAPDGSMIHNVYAGAYAGPGDAEFMRPILEAAGLPANLVERTGSIRT